MSKTKLVLRVNTKGKKSGDVIEVDSEQVDTLVNNGLAHRVKPGPKSEKD